MKLSERIRHLHPRRDVIDWLDNLSDQTPEYAWRTCRNGSHMLWLLRTQSGETDSQARRKLVGCAAKCARLVLPIYELHHPDNLIVRHCLDVADLYAVDNADAVRMDAAAAAAMAMVLAVVSAANAVAVSDAAARITALAACAEIVRQDYPAPPTI